LEALDLNQQYLSDWKKINQVVKEAVVDVLGYEGWRVLKQSPSSGREYAS
jgi:hypothetical protein